MKPHVLISIFVLILFTSCAIRQGVSIHEENNTSENPDEFNMPAPEGIDLTDYLRRFSGIQITGTGSNAQIKIRGGARSMTNSNNDPLFVIDGIVFNGSYSQLYSAVNVNYIDKLMVHKDPADLAAWGSRGANGVIEIKLKKQF